MSRVAKQDWRERVYKRMENREPKNWHEIRRAVLERDNYRCFRCEIYDRRMLSVHHLLPRSEGGGENMENLVSLCNECHNFVEVNNLRTRADIEGSYDAPVEIEEKKEIHHHKESFDRPNWHKWVYGGAKNPNY
jgi:hypothetical protein